MLPTSEDVLIIGTQVDLAAIQAGMNEASTIVTTQTKKMSGDFETTAVAATHLDQAVTKMGGDMGAGGAGVAEMEAQLKAMQATIEQLQLQVTTLEAKLAEAPKRGTGQATEARHAFMGMGEMIGVHVPRFITSFLSHLEGVAPIMAAAFSTVAIVGIITIIPELINKIAETAESLAGLDKEAKKTYEEILTKNREWYLESLKQAEAHRKLTEVGTTGLLKLSREHTNAVATSKDYSNALQQATVNLNLMKEHVDALKHSNDALTAGAILSLGTTLKSDIDEQNKSIDNQTKLVEALQKAWKTVKEQEEAREAAEAAQRIADAFAVAGAQVARFKSVHEAMVTQQMQSAKEAAAMGVITETELISILRSAEERKYEIEKQAIARRRTLVLEEQAKTGKETGPTVVNIDAEAEKARIDHFTRLAAINTEGAAKTLAQDNAVAVAELKAQQTLVNAEVALADAGAKEKLAKHQISIEQETNILLMGEAKRFAVEKQVRQGELEILNQNKEKNKAAIITAQAELEALEKTHQARMDIIRGEGASKELNEQRKIAEEAVRASEQAANKQLQMARELDNTRLHTHQETIGKWAADEVIAINKWYETQHAVLVRQLAEAKRMFGEESVEYKKMIDKMDALDKQRELEVQKVNDKAKIEFQKYFNTVTSQMNNALAQWVTGHETLGKAMTQVWDRAANNFIQNSMKMIEQMLIAAIMHKGILKTEILGEAKSAAAKTYNALAGIPYIGPFIAPPAAAAAFAAVMSFGSFDRGGVAGQDMQGQIHKNEMVLDPSLSIGMQNLIRGGTGGGSQVMHMHYSPVVHNYGGTFEDALNKHGQAVARIVRREMRNGRLPSL